MSLCWCLYRWDGASNSDQVTPSDAHSDIYIAVYQESEIFIINLNPMELFNTENVVWEMFIVALKSGKIYGSSNK